MSLRALLILAVNESQVNIPKTSADAGAIRTGLQVVFGIAGALALLYVTFAGFKYTISAGDPGAVSKAKNQIIYGIIGLIIVLSAFSFITFALGWL